MYTNKSALKFRKKEKREEPSEERDEKERGPLCTDSRNGRHLRSRF